MSHYRANSDDLEFALFDMLDLGKTLAHPAFAGLDEETVRTILAEVRRLAEGPLSDAFVPGDRLPPSFDPATHTAVLPEEIKTAYKALMDAEWWRLELPESLGGTLVPPSVRWAVAEMFLGANPPLFLYAGGPGFAGILERLGTEEQRRTAALMVERQWGATMVLTEPDAGSDVGAGRTSATAQPDGSWHLEGIKRFITGGEHDLAENIVHFVLARPVGVDGAGGPGTKGLSLFIVPKYLFDPETGALGARNGAFVTSIEHKMGLNASTTCELALGVHGTPAKGWLVGDVHDGIAQMFKVIEWARMMVGTKAMATLSTGYLNALDYAQTRVQGPDITRAADKTAPRVRILEHPDVRRMLMLQKAYAEGLRALVLYTASWQDRALLASLDGDEAALDVAERMNDLLLPLVKGVGSERSYEMLAMSLQTLGGSGYVQDYPFEQYLRDAKIDTLYEGTTAIQGMDFLFRKMAKDGLRSWGLLVGEIQQTLDAAPASLAGDADLVRAALDEIGAMIAVLSTWLLAGDPRLLRRAAENTTRLLLAVGDLLLGWLLLRQASIAHDRLADTATDTATDPAAGLLEGKVAACHFFARTVLPRLASERAAMESTDDSLQDVSERAF